MVETVGLVAAVEAVDAMLKASDVQLVRQQRVVPGLITHLVVGETAAVRAAVDAGVAAAERVGKVAASHVIARPSDDIWRRLLGVSVEGDAPSTPAPAKAAAPETTAPAKRAPRETAPRQTAPATPEASPSEASPSGDTPSDYSAMTVRTLRSLVRGRDDVALQGRAVASATKDDLVGALRDADAAAADPA